ncbi:MAG: hypothetical protein CL561_13740 [Alphaproteobacteria bacterium]|nr:hypothetical protein [Alphaproteobacteria bacterium]|tara:strand:- start:122 stop:1348 length:1227 start_codon:yes stop_codon:yes gene_type:complete
MIGYPAYKKSSIEWICNIPASWDVLPLFSVGSESRISNKGMVEDNLLSLSFGKIVRKDIETLGGLLPESFETYQVVNENDIVFRLTDLQNDKRSLRSAICVERGIITSAYIAVTPKKIRPKYFHYLMRAYDEAKVFYNLGSGMRQSLKFSELKRLPIIIPSTQEQEQIERFLDKKLEEINYLIEAKKDFLVLLKEKRCALVDASVRHNETKMMRLGYCASQKKRPISYSESTEYIPIGLYNRGRGIFRKVPTLGRHLGDSHFFYIQPGDLILSGQFAWEGAAALVGSENSGCVASHRYPILRGMEGVLETSYLWAYLTTREGDFLLNEHSRGSAGRNRPLNINGLMKAKIPVPSMRLQQEISKFIEEERKILEAIKKFEKHLRELGTTLVYNSVVGAVDLRSYEMEVE